MNNKYAHEDRDTPFILLITGLPCTGKTYIGKKMAEIFLIPYIYKDGIKECLFDQLGWEDRAWSRRLGKASYALMFYFAELLLIAGKSLIMESNFNAEEHGKIIESMQEKYHTTIVQVQCVADGQVIADRFLRRWHLGERHPGHVDKEAFDELQDKLHQGRLQPLPIKEHYIEVDTTDFESVDIPKLVNFISSSLF